MASFCSSTPNVMPSFFVISFEELHHTQEMGTEDLWYLDSHGTTRPDKHILKLLLIINDWLIVLGFTPYPIRQYLSHITAVLIIRVKRRVVIPRALLDEEVRKMKNEMYMSKKAERVHV